MHRQEAQVTGPVLITKVPVMSHLWVHECFEDHEAFSIFFLKKYFMALYLLYKNKFIFYDIIIQHLSQ